MDRWRRAAVLSREAATGKRRSDGWSVADADVLPAVAGRLNQGWRIDRTGRRRLTDPCDAILGDADPPQGQAQRRRDPRHPERPQHRDCPVGPVLKAEADRALGEVSSNGSGSGWRPSGPRTV